MPPLSDDLRDLRDLPFRHSRRLRLLVLLADELAGDAPADSLRAASERLQERELAGDPRLADVPCSPSTVCALPLRLAPLTRRVFGRDVELFRKGREGMPCMGLTPAGLELVRLARVFLSWLDETGAPGS